MTIRAITTVIIDMELPVYITDLEEADEYLNNHKVLLDKDTTEIPVDDWELEEL